MYQYLENDCVNKVLFTKTYQKKITFAVIKDFSLGEEEQCFDNEGTQAVNHYSYTLLYIDQSLSSHLQGECNVHK